MPKSIFDQYVAAKAKVDASKEAVKVSQEASRDILKTILDEEGKGPHDFGDKRCIIVERKGVLCLMAKAGPRIKASKEPKAAKEPKAVAAPKTPKVSKKAAAKALADASP